MTTLAYLDLFSGISGDMLLSAIVDAGAPLDQLTTELKKLHLDGWEITAEKGKRGFLAGTHLEVITQEQHAHRHLAEIARIINGSELEESIKRQSLRVFELLAKAEGKVHGISPEEVHFHEVGALDAIIDIVGCVVGLKLLGVEKVYASALVPAELEGVLVNLLMMESTTLGVRRRSVERYVCERREVTVETEYGEVRAKQKVWQGQVIATIPEYEDCARVAREKGVPIGEVFRRVGGK